MYIYRQHRAQRKAPVFNLRFSGFRLAGVTRCTDGGEIWHGGLRAKLHPHRCNDQGTGPPKLKKILLRFDQNVEHKRPTGAYPLRDFHKFCTVCTPLHDALVVKIR